MDRDTIEEARANFSRDLDLGDCLLDEVRSALEILEVPKSNRDYRRLAHGLQRAELEALLRANERDQGDWSGDPETN